MLVDIKFEEGVFASVWLAKRLLLGYNKRGSLLCNLEIGNVLKVPIGCSDSYL